MNAVKEAKEWLSDSQNGDSFYSGNIIRKLLCVISDHEAAIKQAEKEIEELKSGIYEGVYLSACYCAEGHICSPCNIKMKIAIKLAVEEEREVCAKLIERYVVDQFTETKASMPVFMAAAIRARGANKEKGK